MAKRRTSREGSLHKQKDGCWEGRYTAGRDPETGRVIYKNVLGKTQAEAKAKLKIAIGASKSLGMAKASQYTIGRQMEVWSGHYAKVKVWPSSHQTYRGYIDNHIKPNIGKILLEKLTSLELQRLYKELLEQGRVDRLGSRHQAKGLSPKTVRNIYQVISPAMDLAREQELIAANLTEGCALSRLEHKEMRTLLVEQLQSFLRGAKDSGAFKLYYLELATGPHQEELLGLEWGDIDLERGDLRVRRQIARISGKVAEAPLKTENACHTLPLIEDTVDVLRAQRKRTRGSPWVFPSPAGGPVPPGSVLHILHRMLGRAGLPRVRFHNLRHTCATLALRNGVDVKTVSGILGHFSVGFTLDAYAHVATAP